MPEASLTKLDDGQYVIYGGGGFITYNPADPNFGGTYTLTTPDGTKYTLDGNSDLLSSIADRNNNTLTFTDAGITSSTGVGITFTRDAQDRITSITDPSGATIAYAYNAAGDLVSITDRTGAVTQIFYDPTRPHFIDHIVNSLGVTAIRTEYDSSGRLIGLFDAQGHLVQQTNDTSSLTQTVVDALGNTTTTTFDTEGNPVKIVDALGGVTTNTFDANDDLLTTTDPLGHTTTGTYDSRGNVLTESDPLGSTTYNSFNEMLSSTSPLGSSTSMTYDDRGNVSSTTDAHGATAQVSVDGIGNLSSVVDASGLRSQFTYAGTGQASSFTNSSGVTHSFTYDASGNALTDAATWTNPADASDSRVLVDSFSYDADGRTLATAAPDGTTATTYDSLGRVTREVDKYGGTTSYVNDALNNVLETDNADGTLSRAVYDANARVVWSQDPHLPAQPADGTRTYYDPLGRVVRTERYHNVVIKLNTAAQRGVGQYACLVRSCAVLGSNGEVRCGWLRSSTDRRRRTCRLLQI